MGEGEQFAESAKKPAWAAHAIETAQRLASRMGAQFVPHHTLPPIMLHCPDCDREMMAQRADTDPPTAAVARIQCDRCDDGDTHSPEFYDAAGSWVDPVAHIQETCA